MSDSHQYGRPVRLSRPFENRQNRDPESRSSYLRHFQEKEKQEKNQIQMIFKQADSSIENILNNSMSHIDKVIQGIDTPIESLSIQDISKQNVFLKDNLVKMKRILKERLEAGLTKQREELADVIGNYISLITKLLQDKEELTAELKHNQSHKCRQNQFLNKIDSLKESNLKLKHILDQREQQIQIDKIKIDQFLTIIDNYQEDELKNQQRNEAMMIKLQMQESETKSKIKEQMMSTSFSDKKDNYDAKIQTLLELLESTQEKNKQLKDQIKSLQRQKEELRQNYEEKIISINQDNEEEFLEYEKAVRQTLDTKDECIERLNAVVESLKRK